MKAFKNPPTIVNLVGQTICLIFNKEPSFSNFCRLINLSNNFIRDSIQAYDFDSTSDYVLKELEKYISIKDFNEMSSKSYIAIQKLQIWVTAVYRYGISKQQVLILIIFYLKK